MRRDLAQAPNEAGRAHGEGRLDQAELRYLAILRAHPDCFEALHLCAAEMIDGAQVFYF